MSKTTIVVVIVLLWLLLRQGSSSSTGTSSGSILGNLLYGPPPRPMYAISPPTHRSTAVTDIISTALVSGAGVLNNYLNSGQSSSPSPVIQATTPVVPDAIDFSELD